MLDTMPCAQPCADEAAPALVALPGRWLALGEVERRAFLAIADELGAISRLIEDSTASLTTRFRALAVAAMAQAGRVQDIAPIAGEVDVGGRRATTTEVVGLVESAVVEAGEAFHRISGQAGTMVRALDDVVADMVEVEKLVSKIEGISNKARYVSLNAAIEANRARDPAAR